MVLHGTAGGLFSVAGGGKFQSGFLAAGLAELAGPHLEVDGAGVNAIAANTVTHAVIGGLGSAIGGGKFENGAVTGAFGYLFNEGVHLAQVGSVPVGAGTILGAGGFTTTFGIIEVQLPDGSIETRMGNVPYITDNPGDVTGPAPGNCCSTAIGELIVPNGTSTPYYFPIFANVGDGQAYLWSTLTGSYYFNGTVDHLLSKFVRGGANSDYAKDVLLSTGSSRDTVVNTLDSTQFSNMYNAIIRQEGSTGGGRTYKGSGLGG